MSLEDLLKPVKWLDQEMQADFTRYGQRLSELPDSLLYTVTLNLTGYGGVLTNVSFASMSEVKHYLWPYFFFTFPDLILTIYKCCVTAQRPNSETTSDTAVVNPVDFLEHYNRKVRLPVLLTSAGFLGSVAYDITLFLQHVEPLTTQTLSNAGFSIDLLSVASSMYLKDQDPKLLDRKPLLKRAYSWITEKLQSLTPQPVPESVPARYRAIDADMKTLINPSPYHHSSPNKKFI